MRAAFSQFRKAPGRIIASVFALALAVAAIGVLAIPTVSEGTLHAAVQNEGLADIVVSTTPLGADQVAAVASLPDVAAAEGEIDVAVDVAGREGRLVGQVPGHSMNVLTISEGRDISAPGEAVTNSETGSVGDVITVDGVELTIVGRGSTLWWSGVDSVVFTDLETAATVAAGSGANRLVVTAIDDSEDSLRALSDRVRDVLAADGDTYTEFPIYLPDGTTPIDADIRQVSTLIGLLGIFAGLVAMVLLASTVSTLITERTREVALMRALGGRSRPLRRRLRRIALAITAAALVIGLPLGILISNLIARMVLEEFVGLTPAAAVDWQVLVGSALAMLLGARLVSARAARRVTSRPLAEALRDRDGAPFGRGAVQRGAARLAPGGLLSRLAGRSTIRRPGRTVAVVAQIATAVGAAFLVTSLAGSVNAYNTAFNDPWSWQTRAVAQDPGLAIPQSIADDQQGTESSVWTFGEVEGWEIDAIGMTPDTAFFEPVMKSGTWLSASAPRTDGNASAVVSAGFADRTGIEVGDEMEIELASGPAELSVVGLVDDHSRTIYLDREELATLLGSPGMANVVWSSSELESVDWPVQVGVDTAADIAAEEAAGRDAIVLIFGAIGVIVAGVAALAVISSMSVSLYERRHEMATMQALGARRRRLRSLLIRELLVVGSVGLVAGLALGALGTQGIIASFESSNAVDIGVELATGAVLPIAVATTLGLVLLAAVVVRSAARRPVAVTLRGAA